MGGATPFIGGATPFAGGKTPFDAVSDKVLFQASYLAIADWPTL